MAVTIKKVSTNEPNVSKREVTYDLYVDGKFKAHYKDLIEAMDAKAALERANSTTYSNGRQKAEIRQIAGGYAVYVDGKEVYDSVSKINCENYIKRNNLGPAVVANSAPYSNGRMKAETYLNQKMAEAGVKVENELEMTVEQIKKGAREGRWELQVDVDDKRPGQHVWVRRNGKDIYIRVK